MSHQSLGEVSDEQGCCGRGAARRERGFDPEQSRIKGRPVFMPLDYVGEVDDFKVVVAEVK